MVYMLYFRYCENRLPVLTGCFVPVSVFSGNLVRAEDVISVVMPFCADQNVDVGVRLGVLDILSKVSHLKQSLFYTFFIHFLCIVCLFRVPKISFWL